MRLVRCGARLLALSRATSRFRRDPPRRRARAIAAEPTVVRLEPLGESGVEALIESILGAPSPPGLASFVLERTAGNPFFLEEVLRSLRETEALVRENGSWTMQPGWDARKLPETIEEVLSARIDLLPRAAATTLQTASVIGRRVPLPLLEEV